MTKLVFAFVPMLVLLGCAELLIRLTGAAETCPTTTKSLAWVCDPLLYFKNNPELDVLGEPLNQAGFRGREFLPKQPGVFRILSIGDSCTFGIAASDRGFYEREPYPQLLERMIERELGPGRVEVLNAGSPGYNSYQGLLLLRTKLRGLAPDLITVRFGWNDHLMSATGREQGAFRESTNPLVRFLRSGLLRTALYPFAIRLRLEARASFEAGLDSPPRLPHEWKPNMTIPDYLYALRSITELGNSMGARVWLLTSPQALASDESLARYESLPKETAARRLLYFNAVPSFARMRDIHDLYNEATRQVARDLEVPLVDMDKFYREANDEKLFSMTDALHPTASGHHLEADVLHNQLIATGILDNL